MLPQPPLVSTTCTSTGLSSPARNFAAIASSSALKAGPAEAANERLWAAVAAAEAGAAAAAAAVVVVVVVVGAPPRIAVAGGHLWHRHRLRVVLRAARRRSIICETWRWWGWGGGTCVRECSLSLSK